MSKLIFAHDCYILRTKHMVKCLPDLRFSCFDFESHQVRLVCVFSVFFCAYLGYASPCFVPGTYQKGTTESTTRVPKYRGHSN